MWANPKEQGQRLRGLVNWARLYKKRGGENLAAWIILCHSFGHWVLDPIDSHPLSPCLSWEVMKAEVIWCVFILVYLSLAQLLYSALKTFEIWLMASSFVGKELQREYNWLGGSSKVAVQNRDMHVRAHWYYLGLNLQLHLSHYIYFWQLGVLGLSSYMYFIWLQNLNQLRGNTLTEKQIIEESRGCQKEMQEKKPYFNY